MDWYSRFAVKGQETTEKDANRAYAGKREPGKRTAEVYTGARGKTGIWGAGSWSIPQNGNRTYRPLKDPAKRESGV